MAGRFHVPRQLRRRTVAPRAGRSHWQARMAWDSPLTDLASRRSGRRIFGVADNVRLFGAET